MSLLATVVAVIVEPPVFVVVVAAYGCLVADLGFHTRKVQGQISLL